MLSEYGCSAALLAVMVLLSSCALITTGAEDENVRGLIMDDTRTYAPSIRSNFFIKNIGQYDDDIVFLSSTGTFAVSKDGLFFLEGPGADGPIFGYTFPGRYMWEPSGKDRIDSYSSFFYGNDPSKWVSGAPHFERISLEDLYPGIDLLLGFRDEHIKYDLLVGPGVSTNMIEIEVRNSLEILNDNSSITIVTGSGAYRESDLLAFYTDGQKESIEVTFSSRGPTCFGFDLKGRDIDRPLVIDPVIFCTLIGGSGDEQACHGKPTDDGGFIYTGNTFGSHPMSGSAYDDTYNGDSDVIVCKVNPDGSSIMWATYIGSSGWERGFMLALGTNEDIYITGFTSSTSFPTTSGAFDEDHNGGTNDQFVLKLSANGLNLLFSTFIGGSGDDQARGLTIDGEGNLLIVGATTSSDFPVTVGAFDTTHNGGFDFTIFKLDPTGTTMIWGTFVGGSGDDTGRDIHLGPLGEIFVMGETASYDAPTSSSSYDRSFSGENDFFVLRINPSGSQLLASTYLGGSKREEYTLHGGKPLWVDDDGYVYVGGNTFSPDFPTTPNCFDSSFGGVEPGGTQGDGFVTRIDPSLGSLSFSTYISGTASVGEMVYGINIDDIGRVYVVGHCGLGGEPNGFPTTENAFDRTWNSGTDGFFLILDRNGSSMEYGTFYGGNYGETIYGIEFNPQYELFIYGKTNSLDFPTTPGAFDRRTDLYEAFVMKWSPFRTPSEPPNFRLMGGETEVAIRWDPPIDREITFMTHYILYRGLGPEYLSVFSENVTNEYFFDTTVSPGIRYYYGVTACNSLGESPMSEVKSIVTGRLPGRPFNLSSSEGDGTVSLKWNLSQETGLPPLTMLTLYRGESVEKMNRFRTFGPTAFKYTDENLTNGQTYFYYLTATNSLGETPPSNIISAMPTSIPSTPLFVEATAGNEVVYLDWREPQDTGGLEIVNYTVLKGMEPQNLSLFSTVQAPETDLTDLEVRNGMTYYYSVSAWNTNGQSTSSKVVFARPMGPPSKPLNLTLAPRFEAVSAMWEEPEDLGGDITCTYRLYRKEPGGIFQQVDETSGTMLTDPGVLNGRMYIYMVLAINSMGTSPPSDEASVTPFGLPSKPTAFTATAGDERVYLSWNEPLELGGGTLLGYSIHRKTGDGEFELMYTDEIGTATSHTDLDVINGREYIYFLKAFTNFGSGAPTDEMSATPLGAPDAPRNTSLSVTPGKIHLSWDEPLDSGGSPITGYRVFRTSGDEIDRQIKQVEPDVLGITDNEADNGIMYYYRICAVNAVGTSVMTEWVHGMTGSPPTPPISIEAVIERDDIRLVWGEPVDDGGSPVTEYIVYRREGESTPTIFARVSGSTHSAMDDNVDRGIIYVYSITSVNAFGESPMSVEVEGMIEKEDGSDPIRTAMLAAIIVMSVIILVLAIILILLLKRKDGIEDGGGTEVYQELSQPMIMPEGVPPPVLHEGTVEPILPQASPEQSPGPPEAPGPNMGPGSESRHGSDIG